MFSKFVSSSLGLLLFLSLFPFPEFIPSDGLDANWKLCLISARENNLLWGRDIAFNLGPFHSIVTKGYSIKYLYNELLLNLLWTLSAIYTIYTSTLLAPLNKNKFYIFILSLVLIGNPHTEINLIKSIPIREGIITFTYLLAYLNLLKTKKFSSDIPDILTLAFSSYIKCPHGFIVIGLLILLNFHSYLTKKLNRAVKITALFILLNLFIWLVSGQDLNLLFAYQYQNFDLGRGYADAMSKQGPFYEVIISAFITILIMKNFKESGLKTFELLGLAVLFLINFKSSFVRHDAHNYILTTNILILSINLLLLNFTSKNTLLLILSTFNFLLIDFNFLQTPQNVFKSTLTNQLPSLSNDIHRLHDIIFNNGTKYKTDFQDAIKNLKNKLSFIDDTKLTATNSYSLAGLYSILNANNLAPTLQGYLYHTKYILNFNLQSLTKKKPQYYLLSLETFDDKNPIFDLGLIIPYILNNYRFVRSLSSKDFLLERMDQPSSEKLNIHPPFKEFKIGEWIEIEKNDSLIVRSIKIHPNYLGHIMGILYKRNILYIESQLSSGEIIRNRLIPEVAAAGFILSPYLGSENSLKNFYLQKSSSDSNNLYAIRKIRIIEGENSLNLSTWQEDLIIH